MAKTYDFRVIKVARLRLDLEEAQAKKDIAFSKMTDAYVKEVNALLKRQTGYVVKDFSEIIDCAVNAQKANERVDIASNIARNYFTVQDYAYIKKLDKAYMKALDKYLEVSKELNLAEIELDCKK